VTIIWRPFFTQSPDGKQEYEWMCPTSHCPLCDTEGTLEMIYRDSADLCIGYHFSCSKCDHAWDEPEAKPYPPLVPRKEG